MASNEIQGRVTQLLGKSDDAATGGDLQTAFETLKEASHLDPENARVKDALVALEKRERTGDAINLLRSYLGTGPSGDGEKALHALRQKHLPKQEAEEALSLLLDRPQREPRALDLLDTLTATLIYRSKDVQHVLMLKFNKPVTELFELLYERGPESLKAFCTTPLNEALWDAKESQARAQRDLFTLCIAKLMDSDVRHPERLMQVVARQLAVAPTNIEAIIDVDVLEVILDSLDIRLDQASRSQAMLATSKALESTKEKGEQLFGQYLAAKVGKQTIDDFIVAFSSAAAVFPMIPATAAQLFMTDGFVQQLVPNLERNFESGSQGKRKSATLEVAALELLSAACVDKACREAIDRYCSPWLRNLSDEAEGKHKALASLVLAKINASSSEEVTSRLADLVLVNEVNKDQAIEGLAYTTLQPKVKEDIAGNANLLKRLVLALTDRPSAAFGCLTIFSNLTTYRPPKTAEQKKMEQLKAYANQQKHAAEDPLDNDGFVTARAKKLLDADIVPALVANCKQTSSPTNIAMVVKTLLAIAKEQKHRTKMVSQGAVKLLLQIRERIAKTDKSTAEASIIDRNASHALARLLISVNPAHVFSAALLASTAVSSLIPLLTYDTDAEQRDLLPAFEALLALTNLASMEDPVARDVLVRSAAFDKLEDLLFSSNVLVQRASVELVCNLMASPSGVAKYADGSQDAKRRLHVLLALSDADDLATRRAAGGALAMLTEWDSAVTAVLDHKKGVELLVGMCEDESDEMKHRGFACVNNLVSAPADVGERAVKVLKDEADGHLDAMKDALRKTKNQDVLALGVEVLKQLQ
ncbi:putative armadillo-like helical, UNC-45/Cro1/She4, central domain-containing protein [Septoria linicola]|nr:putative armadillo-like helical, UNC-45/Cro1/She4, central domain-containing protein [Septoria linicola]